MLAVPGDVKTGSSLFIYAVNFLVNLEQFFSSPPFLWYILFNSICIKNLPGKFLIDLAKYL